MFSSFTFISEQPTNTITLKRMGIGDHFVHQLGAQNYVREAEGLNATAIANLVQAQ